MELLQQSPFLRLPIELIRTVLSFCDTEEVIFTLPTVSRLFYTACNDSNLLRNLIRKDLYLEYTGHNSGRYPESEKRWDKDPISWREKIARCISISTSSKSTSVTCWRKWAVALRSMAEHGPRIGVDITNFTVLLRLMQYLPHALLVGVPVCDDPSERHWLMIVMAFYFLDVTGGPGFRSRLYVQGLNMQETNLRMALCLTALILESRDASFLFERKEILGDQSIAGWLGSAMVYSPDWWAMNSRPVSPGREPANVRILPFITVMFIATAVIYYKDEEIQVLPDLSKVPLFCAADPLFWKYTHAGISNQGVSIAAPPPFDLVMNKHDQHDEPIQASESLTPFETFVDTLHEKMLFDSIDEFFCGTWCIYYLIGQHCDLRDMRFGDAVRGICLRALPIATDEWSLESDPFEESIGISVLTGTMVRNRKICSLTLQKRTESYDFEIRLHGQLSPFGISGGYYCTTWDERATPGGLFWLWKDQWTAEDVGMNDSQASGA